MILRHIPNHDQIREGDKITKEGKLKNPMFDSKIK